MAAALTFLPVVVSRSWGHHHLKEGSRMADDKDDKKVLGTGARESRPETDKADDKKSDKKKKSDD